MAKLFNIVKFCFTAALFGVAVIYVAYYGRVLLNDPSQITEEMIVAVVLLLILSVFLLILFLPLVSFMPERKIRIRVTRLFILAILLAFVAFQVSDAPPPKAAYTAADLKTTDRGEGQLLFLADALLWEKVGTFDFEAYFKEPFLLCSPENFAEEILAAWRRLQPYRILIDQLAAYDRLPQPHYESDAVQPDYAALVNYAYVYRAYVLLRAGRGNLEQAVRDLSVLQRVIRNGLRGSFGFAQKNTWFAMLRINLETAYQVTRDHDLSTDLLQKMQSAFTPLEDSVMDFSQARLEDYLAQKRSLDLSFEQKIQKGLFAKSDAYPLEGQPLWLQRLFYQLTFQRNRTALMLGDTWQSTPGLSPFLATWQRILLSLQIEESLGFNPPTRNLSGWFLFGFDTNTNENMNYHQLKSMADLFADSLNRRLAGSPVSAEQDSASGKKGDAALQPICRP